MHDRPRSEARVPLTVATAVNSETADKGEWRTDILFMMLAVVANKAIWKALAVKIGVACFLACEVLLEVKQRLWRKDASVKFSHRFWLSHISCNELGSILALHALGGNRIGMVSTSFGVTAPSSAAMPSQVAERTNRFESSIPLILADSNSLFMKCIPPSG
jgi:hypothetical protein